MQKKSQKLTYGFKGCICISLTLFLIVVIGAGCVRQTPPPEQGPYIKVQSGKDGGGVTWSK